MKKTLQILLFTLVLASCQKVAVPDTPQCQEVVFSINGIVGSMPTKVTSSEISEALTSIVPPTNIELTLKSKTIAARVVKVTVGIPQSIPLDTYTVTGEYAPETDCYAIYKGRLYNAPTYKVNTEVTIQEGKSDYSVLASYTCLALVFDLDASSSVQILKAGDGTYEEYKDRLTVVGSLGIGYIYTWTSWTPLIIRVYPIDEANYEATTYKINLDQDTYAQYCGKYYYYPVNAAKTASGGLTVSFPNWTNGL